MRGNWPGFERSRNEVVFDRLGTSGGVCHSCFRRRYLLRVKRAPALSGGLTGNDKQPESLCVKSADVTADGAIYLVLPAAGIDLVPRTPPGNLASSPRRSTHIDIRRSCCHNIFVPATMTDDEAAVRRARILNAARWCFLNFGFAKTAFEDIAKRANLSRTLLYRIFNNKEEIYRAVFTDWLVSRRPAAKKAAKGPGNAYDRLLNVCRLMALEPWAEMVGAPMGSEFLTACERIDPDNEALYRKIVHESVATILGDQASAEVFLLALDGLFADHPSMEVLEQRTQLLAARFAPCSSKKGARP
jgi:TetR/AcrR family transcriptional regulator, transcriptional repressor of aconitase